MNTSSIGKRIRKYREAKGWRQEDFAERIGLSVTYTGMIERGEKVPKLETFITIANALEVSADLLLADVLSTGYNIKSSEMTDALSDLPSSERERIYSVVNTMISFEKKKQKVKKVAPERTRRQFSCSSCSAYYSINSSHAVL